MAQREANPVADRSAFRVKLFVVLAFGLVFRLEQRFLQHLLRGDGMLAEDLPGHAGVALLKYVAQTEFDGRQAQFARHVIHQRFVGENDLRRAVAAVGRGVVVVGVNAHQIDAHVRNIVGARRLHGTAPGDKHRLAAVAAAIGDNVDFNRLNTRIVVHANAVFHLIGVALVAFAHRLFAVIGDLYRPPGQVHQQRRPAGDVINNVILAAERAAQHGALNVHLRLGQVKIFGNHRPGAVSVLNRPLDGHDLFIIIQIGGNRFRLNIAVLLETHLILAFENMAGGGESGVDIALRRMVAVNDVAIEFAVNKARPGLHRLFRGGNWLPRGVGDFDFIDRDAGCLVGFRRHHGNHVAAIGDLLVDNRRMIGNDRPQLALAGNIVPGGNTHDAGHFFRLRQVERVDAPGRYIHVATDAIQHIVHNNVIAVDRFTRHLGEPIDAGHLTANQQCIHIFQSPLTKKDNGIKQWLCHL